MNVNVPILTCILTLFSFICRAQPTNDNCANAIQLCPNTPLNGSNIGATNEFSNNGADGTSATDLSFGEGCYSTNNSVWYYFETNATGGNVTINFSGLDCLSGSNYDTDLQASIYEVGTPCDASTYLGVNGSSCYGSQQGASMNDFSITGVGLQPNTIYYIQVDGDRVIDPFNNGSTLPAECNFTIEATGALASCCSPPTVEAIVADESCFGSNDGAVTITNIQGSTGNNSFNWSNGATTTVISNLSPGTYNLVLFDNGNGCQLDTSFTVGAGPNCGGCNLILQNDSAANTLCSVNGSACNGSATVMVSNGLSPYTYEWAATAQNQTTQTATDLCAGIYCVTVTDALGCSDSICVEVIDQLSNSIDSINQQSCFGTQIQIANGNSIIIENDTIISTVLISSTGCDSTIVQSISLVTNYINSVTTTICVGESVIISDGSNQTPISDTIYQSTFISQNGCDSIIYDNILVLNSYIDSLINEICEGEEYTFIDGFSTEVNETSIREIIYQSSNGCDSVIVEQVKVKQPLSKFLFDPPYGTTTESEISFLNLSENANQYSWTIQEINPTPYYMFGTSSESFIHSFPEVSGSYEICLEAKNELACSDISCSTIKIREPYTMYVPNAFTPDNDAFNQSFKPVLNGIDEQNYEMLIFNRWGELVFESHNKEVGWNGYYQGKMVQDGVYVWQIKFKLKFSDERITKKGQITLLR